MELVSVPISVFPVPGGPKSRIPFGGPRKPLKISLINKNKVTAANYTCDHEYAYIRSHHGPNNNLLDGVLGKVESSNVIPLDWHTMVHYLYQCSRFKCMRV